MWFWPPVPSDVVLIPHAMELHFPGTLKVSAASMPERKAKRSLEGKNFFFLEYKVGQGQVIFREKQPSVPCGEVPGHPYFGPTRPLSCLTLPRCLCPASWKWHRRKIQLSCVLDAPIEITPSPDTWGAQTKRGTLGPAIGIEASNSLSGRPGVERLCYLSWEWVYVLSRGAGS